MNLYSPILNLTTLDLTNFLDLVNGEKLTLKTDLKNVPGGRFRIPRFNEILDLRKLAKNTNFWLKLGWGSIMHLVFLGF